MRELLFWVMILFLLRAAWRNPFWGLCIYVGFNIIRPEMLFWGSAPRVSVYLLFAAVLLARGVLKSELKLEAFLQRPACYLILLYAALVVSMLLSSYDTTLGRRFVNEIAVLCVLCALLATYLDTFEKVLLFERFVIAVLALLGIWGIQQHFAGNARMEGIGGNSYLDSNGIAAIYVLFLPVAVHLALEKTLRRAWLWMVPAFILLSLIICTGSRGGAVGLAVAMGCYLLRTRYWVRAISTAALLGALATPLLTSDYIDRVKSVQSTESFDASGLGRLYLWQAAWEIFKDHPLCGTGFLTFSQAKQDYRSQVAIDDRQLQDYVFRPNKVGHNTYLQVLSETGLLGGVPYLLMIIASIVTSGRLRRGALAGKLEQHLGGLGTAVQSGIIGFCVCIVAIDALVDVMFPVQIAISFILNRVAVARSSETVSVPAASSPFLSESRAG